MSFVLFTCLAASAAATGWIVGAGVRSRHVRAQTPAVQTKSDATPIDDRFRAYPFAVGDIVTRGEAEELLLEGALALSEDNAPVAALYFGIAAGLRRMVFALPSPIDDVLWLSHEPVDGALQALPAIEIRGVLYERVRRRPVVVDRCGVTPEGILGNATLAQYTAAGHGELVLLDVGEAIFVAIGERVPLRWITAQSQASRRF